MLRATSEHGCAAINALIHPDETWKGELADRLERYVRELYTAIRQRESIVRAFISEARALPESIRTALQEFMLIKRLALLQRYGKSRNWALVRKEVDVSAAADFIRDSIHSAMLRHTLYRTDPETVDAHLRGITDIFTAK